jgi:branched-chain amino acid transport system permease protein
MTVGGTIAVVALAVLVALLAAVPWFVSDYGLGFMVNLMCYLVLTIAWALFSGTTRYVSLATAAFFGIGAYTVAMLIKELPIYACFGVALVVGTLVASLVGLVTLRVSGMFFVVFGFGLSELMREVLIWWEINRTKTLGRYVFVPFDTTLIYWHLLGLAVLVFLVGWLLRRTRLGVALMVIGDDETMARQAGINVPLAKVVMFIISSVFMTIVGAVMAPRFGYLTPHFAFNPLISFQVVIMALLGGMQRLWGPVLGVIPLILLSELLQVRFPFWYSVLLGAVFMVIVYFLPRGVTGLVEDGWQVLRRPLALPRGVAGPLIDVVAVCWSRLSRPIALPRGIAGAIEDAWARLVRRRPSGGR